MKKELLASLAAFGLLAVAAASHAQSVPQGTGDFAGRDRLRIPGCGRVAHPLSVDATLAANGAWTLDAGADEYAGTSTELRPRLVQLTLDAGSLAALQAKLAADASALCGQTVTVSSLSPHAVLKLNKRETRGVVVMRARGFGSGASGNMGTGVYELGARGPWVVPVP